MSEQPRKPFGQNNPAEASTSEVAKIRRKIGALWTRRSQEVGGDDFLAGEIELTKELQAALETAQTNNFGEKVVSVVIFKNNKKDSAKQPDYRILIGKPREV